MDREFYSDDQKAEAESPYIDKLREYIDLQRGIENRVSEAHRIEKQNAEATARMGAIRRELLGYLEPERSEVQS